MASPSPHPAHSHGALLLADISGYTRFLRDVADAHRDLIIEAPEPPPAYALISTLLDTMVAVIAPSFRLAKFEGDALFAVSDPDHLPRGTAVIDCLRACYAAFHERLDAAGTTWQCRCAACARIGDLDVKFVIHHGAWVEQRIAGSPELLGPDVNTVHRLLKNGVREMIGPHPYALFTTAAARALEVPTDGMTGGLETPDDGAPIGIHVLRLDDRAP